jgi:hypothetical protein
MAVGAADVGGPNRVLAKARISATADRASGTNPKRWNTYQSPGETFNVTSIPAALAREPIGDRGRRFGSH